MSFGETPAPASPLGRYRQLAPSANVKVSPICLGTMSFGDKHTAAYGEVTKSTAMEILDYFYDQGGNFIDTANIYQVGQSEEWIGEWMQRRGNRDEIVLATKYTGHFAGSDGRKAVEVNFGGSGSKSLKLNLEASLKRLGTNYIDLYYVHWWDYATPIPELMHSLNDLVASGKILYIGISDTPAWLVSKANEYARQNGLRPFVVYQGFWNAGMRDVEREIIPMCRTEGMAITPWGALGQGRFQTQAGYEEREKHNPGRKYLPLTERDRAVSKVLETTAAKRNCSLFHVAQAYVIQKTTYVFPLVGLRKLEHLKGAIDGLKVALEEEDIELIERAYDFDHGFPHTALSGSMYDGSRSRTATQPEEVFMSRQYGTVDWVEREKPIKPAPQ